MEINSEVSALKTWMCRVIEMLRLIMARVRAFFPDDIESAFFSIVRKFCMLIASISIIVVVAFSLLSLSDYMSSVDEDISEADVSYSERKDKLQRKHDLTYTSKDSSGSSTEQKERRLKTDSESLEFEKKFDKIYQEIVIVINGYAKIVGDHAANTKYDLRKWFLGKDEGNFNLSYMEDLKDFVEDMRDDADEVKTLKADDIRRVSWDDQIKWFFKKQDAHWNAELERIESERVEVMVNKAKALTQLMVVGVAFGLFMCFVIMLVLIRIESNTRVQTTK